MKKLIILIALVFTALGYSQAEFEKIALTENGVSTSTNKINTQEANGEINYIDAVNLPVSTATTNALELETDVSAGAVSGFTLTNNGNGTVNISSGIAYLRATNDPYAPIIKYPIAAVTNLALTDNANNYVLVDYNGGSPTLTVTTNGSTINTQTNSLAFLIARVGNNLDYLSLVGQNVDPNAKLRVRFLNQEGIRRASGAVLGFSNRNLTLTSSVLFSGLIRINAVAFNTASPDTFTLAYNNGSTWTRTTGQTQINNTQYNNAGVLTTMPNNNFRTDYVYLLPNNPSKLYVIMGSTTYSSLTLAKAAPRPSILPVELQAIGLEVGRLFIEKNSTTIAEVQSSFANEFTGAPVPEHNSLTGLQGGTSGEYNHLTNAQVALVDGSEQGSNKATSFSTVNNTLYPTVQAVKNYADNLVVGLLNDRGSYDASSNLFPSTGGSGTAGEILKGNLWAVSVAGTLGGVAVGIGDWIRALVDTPGQTASNWSIVEGNFGYVPENVANKSSSYTVSSTTTYPNTKALVDGLATKQNTLTNPVTGTGTANFIPKWTGTNTQGNSSFTDNGSTSQSGVPFTSVRGSGANYGLRTSGTSLSPTSYGFYNVTIIGSANTSFHYGNSSELATQAASFTVNTVSHFRVQNVGLGAGSSVTNQFGFTMGDLTSGTNNYGFYGDVSSGSNKWNLYMNGTAKNYLNGNLLVGITTDNGNKGRFAGTVDVNKLQLNNTPATATGTPPLLTWNSTTKDVESIPYATFAPTASPALTGTPTAPTPTTGTGIANKDYVDSAVSAVGATSGTYTPTLSGAVNLTSTSLIKATYTKVGDIVTVYVAITGTTTSANSLTAINITLPVSKATATAIENGMAMLGGANNNSIAMGYVSIGQTSATLYSSTTGASGSGYKFKASFQYNVTE